MKNLTEILHKDLAKYKEITFAQFLASKVGKATTKLFNEFLTNYDAITLLMAAIMTEIPEELCKALIEDGINKGILNATIPDRGDWNKRAFRVL